MEFFALIPVWIAGSLFYLASARQLVISNPLNKPVAYAGACLMLVVAVLLISHTYPWISAVLACLVMIMCLLPIVSVSGAYGGKRFYSVSASFSGLSVVFAVINGGLN